MERQVAMLEGLIKNAYPDILEDQLHVLLMKAKGYHIVEETIEVLQNEAPPRWSSLARWMTDTGMEKYKQTGIRPNVHFRKLNEDGTVVTIL